MSRLLTALLCCFLIISVFGCSARYELERFYSMGTFVSVTLPEKNKETLLLVRSEMQKLENLVKDSTESANRSQDFQFNEIIKRLYTTGKRYSEMTDGKFSVFAYTIAKLYGFHEGPYSLPSQEELDKALSSIDREEDVLMDMGAYAKGYIVDRSVDLIRSKGVKSAMVNAGGDLYALGKKGDRKWRVAIKHPLADKEYLSVVNLEDMALATSGDYERYFVTPEGERIFHIFDAVTGKNPSFYHSVSVIADSAEEADGLATVFFLLDKERIARECVLLKTPVLLYTYEKEKIKLCGWDDFES